MSNLSSFYCLFIFSLFTLPLNAEDHKSPSPISLDTILISGTKPSADFPINAPLNLTEFNQTIINDLGFTRVQDVADYVANYNLIDAGANGFSDRSSIRGLTNTPVYTTPAIVLYVDDIPYLSSFSYTNQLVGVDSIEVFKGPQGSLFGKNSYAGVVNVKSRRPGNQFQSHLSVDKGNFDSLNIDGYLSGALIKDQLFFSLGSIYSKREGYLNNTFLDTDADFQDHLNGKMSLLWTPNSQWEINLTAEFQDFDDGAIRAVSLLSDDIYKIQSNEKGSLDQDANSQALKLSYQNQQIEVLSISSRRESDTAYSTDFDLLPQPFFSQKSHLIQKQWSQELRIKSLDESLWRWSMGLFFSHNDISGKQTNTVFNIPDRLNLKILNETSYAIFGQLSYQGFDPVRIFLDLRLDYVEKEIDRSLHALTGQTTLLKENHNDLYFSPKLTLDYKISPQINTYFTTGLAFKPGGFSAQSNAVPQYKKETMWHNEVGVNSTWLNKRITAGFSFFYYDIENYQLEEIFTPSDYTVVNVPEVTSYGAEFNFGAKIFDKVQVSTSFAYTQIEFKDYIDPFTKENFKGNKAPYVPVFNFNISGEYKHPSGFFTRLTWIWNGKTYFDAANSDSFSEQDYKILNAFMGYKYKYFSINAYAKNLTESEYFTFKVARLNFGTPGEPRTFGMSVSADF